MKQSTPPDSPQSVDFSELGLSETLLAALAKLGYETPTEIQREAIPALLQGRDVLGQAATGTGKTAAFGLPLLQLLLNADSLSGNAAAIILVPTRELAIQVGSHLTKYAVGGQLRVVPVYGGQPISTQLRMLRRGVDVIVATPGRLLDHMERKSIRLGAAKLVVLDEADEMLDMGFAEDLDSILSALPETRQTALFSATLPKRIADLAARHLKNPVKIQIRKEVTAPGEAPRVKQLAYVVQHAHKMGAMQRILAMEEAASAIIFCRTRSDVDAVAANLGRSGHGVEALHGGLSQEQRDRVMQRFRGSEANLLVATDVAARGLDIDHVSHVVNYDMPSSPEVYVHRVGRTGRAGREGVAITLVKPSERRLLQIAERKVGAPIVVTPLPTVKALQEHRRQKAFLSVVEQCEKAPDASQNALVQQLVEKFSPEQLADLALTLAAGGQNAQAMEDIPSHDARSRNPRERDARDPRGARREAAPRNQRRAAPRQGEGGWEVAQLFVGAGRNAGVRASDLVGAIANELDLDSRAIGAIQITEKFSLVEVPAEIIDDIVTGMRGSTLKGKRVLYRRDRDTQA